uniref:Uncharacterized protein n=1 Tax=Strongyloides papillosus TaxID=174720 RepID=A0A0N5CCU5_STREA
MRRSYTADLKLKALMFAEIHGTRAAAFKHDCLESLHHQNMPQFCVMACKILVPKTNALTTRPLRLEGELLIEY